MGQSASVKAKREVKERHIVAVDFTPKRTKRNFSFVNDSPRRLLSRRAGIEGRGALRSFALTTCVRVKETGRYARTLKRDQGGPRRAIGRARRANGAGANLWRSKTGWNRVSARKYGDRRRHVLVPQLDPASGDHRHLIAGAGAHRVHCVAFQRDREPRALQADAQRYTRIRLDGRAGAGAGYHCGALVPAARGPTHHSRAGLDAEGDSLTMALELRLSEIRGWLFIRFALCRGKGPKTWPA